MHDLNNPVFYRMPLQIKTAMRTGGDILRRISGTLGAFNRICKTMTEDSCPFGNSEHRAFVQQHFFCPNSFCKA